MMIFHVAGLNQSIVCVRAMQALIPVIATIMQFSPDDMANINKALDAAQSSWVWNKVTGVFAERDKVAPEPLHTTLSNPPLIPGVPSFRRLCVDSVVCACSLLLCHDRRSTSLMAT